MIVRADGSTRGGLPALTPSGQSQFRGLKPPDSWSPDDPGSTKGGRGACRARQVDCGAPVKTRPRPQPCPLPSSASTPTRVPVSVSRVSPSQSHPAARRPHPFSLPPTPPKTPRCTLLRLPSPSFILLPSPLVGCCRHSHQSLVVQD